MPHSVVQPQLGPAVGGEKRDEAARVRASSDSAGLQPVPIGRRARRRTMASVPRGASRRSLRRHHERAISSGVKPRHRYGAIAAAVAAATASFVAGAHVPAFVRRRRLLVVPGHVRAETELSRTRQHSAGTAPSARSGHHPRRPEPAGDRPRRGHPQRVRRHPARTSTMGSPAQPSEPPVARPGDGDMTDQMTEQPVRPSTSWGPSTGSSWSSPAAGSRARSRPPSMTSSTAASSGCSTSS